LIQTPHLMLVFSADQVGSKWQKNVQKIKLSWKTNTKTAICGSRSRLVMFLTPAGA